MDPDQIFGVIAGVFAGNALSVWFFYAIFWGEAQRKRGMDERGFPGWFTLAATAPPLLTAWFAYMALY